MDILNLLNKNKVTSQESKLVKIDLQDGDAIINVKSDKADIETGVGDQRISVEGTDIEVELDKGAEENSDFDFKEDKDVVAVISDGNASIDTGSGTDTVYAIAENLDIDMAEGDHTIAFWANNKTTIDLGDGSNNIVSLDQLAVEGSLTSDTEILGLNFGETFENILQDRLETKVETEQTKYQGMEATVRNTYGFLEGMSDVSINTGSGETNNINITALRVAINSGDFDISKIDTRGGLNLLLDSQTIATTTQTNVITTTATTNVTTTKTESITTTTTQTQRVTETTTRSVTTTTTQTQRITETTSVWTTIPTSSTYADPIGFVGVDGTQYDFFVDSDNNGTISGVNEFLGVNSGWAEMKALDINNDNKITREELESAQDLKLVVSNVDGSQEIKDISEVFGEADKDDVVIDLDSYEEVNLRDEFGNFLVGTFDVDLDGEGGDAAVDGHHTLDNIDYINNKYFNKHIANRFFDHRR